MVRSLWPAGMAQDSSIIVWFIDWPCGPMVAVGLLLLREWNLLDLLCCGLKSHLPLHSGNCVCLLALLWLLVPIVHSGWSLYDSTASTPLHPSCSFCCWSSLSWFCSDNTASRNTRASGYHLPIPWGGRCFDSNDHRIHRCLLAPWNIEGGSHPICSRGDWRLGVWFGYIRQSESRRCQSCIYNVQKWPIYHFSLPDCIGSSKPPHGLPFVPPRSQCTDSVHSSQAKASKNER